MLPSQGAATGKTWSLARDNQLGERLEASLQKLHGRGILAGGMVTQTAVWSVEIAAGTVFYDAGVSYELAEALGRTVAEASETLYLWARIVRTAANQALPAALDTYAVLLTHTVYSVAGDTPPAEDYSLVAILTTGVSGITAIASFPAGGRVRCLAAPLVPQRDTIQPDELVVVADGEQVLLFDSLRIESGGALAISGSGKVRILA